MLQPKQLLKGFLLGACLVWVVDKVHRAYLEGRIRGRRRTYVLAEDPASFNVFFALDVTIGLILALMIVRALYRGTI